MKKIKIIIYSLLFIFIIILGLQISSKIFIPKWLDNKDNMHTWISKGFYEEEKNSLDLLFIGNSDVYRGISPIVLWDDYGIASYAYTSAGQRVWTAYYMLKEALLYQKPKVVVFGVDAVFSDNDSSKANYHKAFDNMKNNSVKFEAINDVVYNFTLEEKISFYLPIIKYHSRYNELSKNDFKYAFYNYHFAYKGLDMTTKIKPYKNGYDYMDKVEEIKISDKVKKYLDGIVKLCNDNNIELVFTELPSADSWNLSKSEAINNYAKENNIKFIDLNKEKIDGFDWMNDTSDGGDHLNVFGAEKVTKYLGEYLTSNYQFINHKNEANYKQWNLDSKKYHEDKDARILKVNN